MRGESLDITRNPVLSERRSWASERTSALLILLPILLGFALRMLRLGFQPLWWDEGYSVWFATHPLPQLLALTAADIHPPLYYILLRGWIGVFGPGPIALRMFSVVVGVLAIPLIYVVARRLFTPRVGWLAAFLLAISPMHIYYSQEVRMYGLAMLLGLGALWAGWEALEVWNTKARSLRSPRSTKSTESTAGPAANPQPANVQALLLYILLATAALYTLYYAALIPIGLTVYALLRAVIGPREARLHAAHVGPLVRRAGGRRAALSAVVALRHAAPDPLRQPEGSRRRGSPAGAAGLRGPAPGGVPRRAPRRPARALLAVCAVVALSRWASACTCPGVEALAGLLQRQGTACPPGQRAAEGSTPVAHARTRTRHAIIMLLTVLVTALALGWLIGLRFPFFPPRGERLLLIVLPAFLMLVAVGVDGLLRANRLAGYRDDGADRRASRGQPDHLLPRTALSAGRLSPADRPHGRAGIARRHGVRDLPVAGRLLAQLRQSRWPDGDPQP